MTALHVYGIITLNSFYARRCRKGKHMGAFLPKQTEHGTVTVFALHVDDVRRADLKPLCERLPERMERAGRFRFERDRLLCIGAGLLLLDALGVRDQSELQVGAHGKPLAAGYPGFSLSHSGDWVVLAVGEGEIGVDIAVRKPAGLRVAASVFTEEERAWMADDPLVRFQILWTLKESVVKATGQGIGTEPSTPDVLPLTEGRPIVSDGAERYAYTGWLEDCCYSVCASYPPKVALRLCRCDAEGKLRCD